MTDFSPAAVERALHDRLDSLVRELADERQQRKAAQDAARDLHEELKRRKVVGDDTLDALNIHWMRLCRSLFGQLRPFDRRPTTADCYAKASGEPIPEWMQTTHGERK